MHLIADKIIKSFWSRYYPSDLEDILEYANFDLFVKNCVLEGNGKFCLVLKSIKPTIILNYWIMHKI